MRTIRIWSLSLFLSRLSPFFLSNKKSNFSDKGGIILLMLFEVINISLSGVLNHSARGLVCYELSLEMICKVFFRCNGLLISSLKSNVAFSVFALFW